MLLQGIFPTQGSNPCLLHLLRWQGGFFTTELPQKQPPPPLRWLLPGSVDLCQSYPPTALSPTPPVPSKYVNVAHTAPTLFEQKHFFIMNISHRIHGILQEYRSGLSCPTPGDLPNPGMECTSLRSPCIGRWVLYH